MPPFAGLCGRFNPRPCTLSWSSTFPNNIGSYPSDFLPAKRTIWHASFDTRKTFSPPIIGPGDVFPPIGGLVDPTGGLNPPQIDSFTFQSFNTIIFAKTENRLNVPHILTQDEIDKGEINVGDYIFEAVAVTDQEQVINFRLTDAEKAALEEADLETEEDRAFRKIFELNIPREQNRLNGIKPNIQGAEYRLDNGTRQSLSVIDSAGRSDLESVNYRDGTSKILSVDMEKVITKREDAPEEPGTLQKESRAPRDGDTVFLTYVAVKEHYLRQHVVTTWSVTAQSIPPICASNPTSVKVVNYRFFKWDMEPEEGDSSPQLEGWRAVESFNARPNVTAPVSRTDEPIIGDFPLGGSRRSDIAFNYLPGKITKTQLQEFLDDRTTLPTLTVTKDGELGSDRFHTNAGVTTFGTEPSCTTEATDWFQRRGFTTRAFYNEVIEHVFFNVHPRALRKRDIDKWGIDRFLAEELEKDIKDGKLTCFPFMDDPDVNEPTSGAVEFLSSANSKFLPVQPVSRYSVGNAEIDCDVGDAAQLGTGVSPDDIFVFHNFNSNFMTEPFDVGTRVLVERFFAVDQRGPRIIAIEGAGGTKGGVTCIADPSKAFGFAGHINDDKFVVYNVFNNSKVQTDMKKLSFRPDQPAPPLVDNNTPTVDQFEELLGISSMLGGVPGIQPGRAIAASTDASLDSFIFKTTNPTKLRQIFPNVEDSQIEELTFTQNGSLNIATGEGYHSIVQIEYNLPESTKSDRAFILARSGSSIDGMATSLVLRAKASGIQIDLTWLKADNLELIGPRVEDMVIKNINVVSMNESKVNDFLNEGSSHSVATDSIAERLSTRSLFFESNILTMSEDGRSNLYIFFNDSDSGISAVSTSDFGTWRYYYGVIEKLEDNNSENPFAVTQFSTSTCYIFYQFLDKILCRKIPFGLFDYADANLIQRFSDIFTEGDPPTENSSIYSSRGKTLRRSLISNIASGDLTDTAFLELVGKDPITFAYDPFEKRIVNGTEVLVRKTPIAVGPNTAFVNKAISDIFFSAYRKDNGELRLWFMGDVNGESHLQCNFSIDDGTNWYYLWEFIEHGYDRLRFDTTKATAFIDRSASTNTPSEAPGEDDSQGDQDAEFGINIHWSRLTRHKTGEGDLTINSESQVLDIASPYVFYQPSTEKVFLFYVYENCLLCKVFNDAIFTSVASGERANELSGIALVKDVIERRTRAYFIDGSLVDSDLQEELHGLPNQQTNEIMTEGNIIFRYPFDIGVFNADREISPQRVCAYDLPTGLVRVFYKHTGEVNLKSALWTGAEWWAEDFMRQPGNLPDVELTDVSQFSEVTGGFGGTGF